MDANPLLSHNIIFVALAFLGLLYFTVQILGAGADDGDIDDADVDDGQVAGRGFGPYQEQGET